MSDATSSTTSAAAGSPEIASAATAVESGTRAAGRVKTAHVKDRRTLHFQSIEEALADAERLAAAERGGSLQYLGNWTLGQALGHLSTWCNFAYDGTPLRTPFFVRWILRTRKGRYLRGPLAAGVRIPRVAGGTLGTEIISTEEGLERFRRSFGRLAIEVPTKPSAIFGPLTHQEFIQLNLRHAELHLSFFKAG